MITETSHHAQCSDPNGRVIFKIERTGELGETGPERPEEPLPEVTAEEITGGSGEDSSGEELSAGPVKDLTVVVEEVRGKCTSGMKPGDSIVLRSGRLHLPPGGHFCLYALQALLPLLPAKQRLLAEGDWMAEEHHVICPDPAGNVIMRIERKD